MVFHWRSIASAAPPETGFFNQKSSDHVGSSSLLFVEEVNSDGNGIFPGIGTILPCNRVFGISLPNPIAQTEISNFGQKMAAASGGKLPLECPSPKEYFGT